MKARHIGIIITVAVILSLIIAVAVLSKQLDNAKDTIYKLEHKPTGPTTTAATTQPNLKPSPMSFTTNNWVFDDTAAACDKTIPITINIPIKDKSFCSTPKPT